jgi:hypothetical protein
MNKTTIISTVIAGLMLSLGIQAWYSPYAFPDQIKAATTASDTNRLEQLIDYDQVQASVSQSIIDNASEEIKPFAARLAPLIAVTTLTPKNTIQFYNSDVVDLGYGNALINVDQLDSDTFKQQYVNINTFEYRISSQPQNNSHNEYTITAKRRGLWKWQVVAVNFKIVEQTIPVTTPLNTRTFVRPIPPTFLTADRQVSCSVDNNAIACTNIKDEGMFCDQSSCEYNENGTPFMNGPVYTGNLEHNNLRCTVTASTVQCYVGNTSGEVTSEYVEILGDISGARG